MSTNPQRVQPGQTPTRLDVELELYDELAHPDHPGASMLADALLYMHGPSASPTGILQCDGCEFTGYDGEPPYWPCATCKVVAGFVAGRGFDELVDARLSERRSQLNTGR
jgi:hypothetical protein